MNQRTIKNETTIEGIGLHTGNAVAMTFKPAETGHGIRFVRIDLPSKPQIRADITNVSSTLRGTTLQQDNVEVHTVEHALAALAGLSIDNVLIEINGDEVPIVDGSSGPFVSALLKAGIVEQDEPVELIEITAPISYSDEKTGSEFLALPHDGFQLTTLIDFDSKILGQQYAFLNSLDDFATEIAPCRTFVFLHELEYLVDHNLIKGGDLTNAIVIVDKLVNQSHLDNLAKKLNKPSVKIDHEGILNTSELYFNNEPARHKLLDIIGDLALLGKPIRGKIVATKPGHTSNVEFAKLIRKNQVEARKLKGIPKYDPNVEPIYTAVEIENLLPHRYPFLLVDKVIEMSDSHIVGVKNVTFNETFFQGHFPGNPIMPGVLQIEALAQAGGLLALSIMHDPGGKFDTYFLKIDNVKFKNKVVPGDTLLLKMELLAPIRRGLVQMHGSAYVGNKLASEGDLTAQVVKRVDQNADNKVLSNEDQ
jgi:UDP-3-O-[3-hydroxymyristoyl] N-acetylglucosamine deacetylase / 3-hydroxyacyl-[acyl-carrier-protein] dehydratase